MSARPIYVFMDESGNLDFSGRGTDHFVHSVVADKHLAHPSKHAPEVFYALVGKAMVSYLLQALPIGFEPVVLMFDSALTGKLKGAFLKAPKPQLNSLGRP